MTVPPPMNMQSVEDAAARLGRGPVPSAPCFDPDHWELERQAIFLRTWIHVGHVCELPYPGSFFRREAEFAIEAGQRGIRGIDKVNFQDHEILLRHLYETVQQKIEEYKRERIA